MFRNLMLVCAVLIFTCATVSNGFAADLKIGIMNVQKIIVGCDAGKDAKVRFEKKMKDLQASFQKEESELKALQEEIKKKSSAWSEEKKSEKTREFQKRGREFQAKSEEARFEMKQLQDKELEPILKALEKIVDTYRKDNGYTMILDSKNGVISYDEKIDISAKLIKILDKAMAK